MKNCIMILLILFIVSSCIPINNKGFNSYKKNTNKHGYWIYINDTVNTYEIVEYKYGKKNSATELTCSWLIAYYTAGQYLKNIRYYFR